MENNQVEYQENSGMTEMVILENVYKEYTLEGHPVRVLNIPHMSIRRGEMVGIRGSSGSGKTTLINILAGILTPSGGTVWIDGTDLYELSEARRDIFRAGTIGYVFQNYHLIPSLTAWDNVMSALYFSQWPRSDRTCRCRQVLERVGLSGRIHNRPAQLSGGEQQRVSLARALSTHPALLLADEPTANLDQSNRNMVLKLMQEMCREEGSTLITASHDEEVLSGMDRVIDL